MTKLLKMFIALALGLGAPFSIMAENPSESYDLGDTEDFDLKNLEEELRRLLEDNQEDAITSEKDTLVINPSMEDDEAQKLEIEYKEPMNDALKQEFKALPIDTNKEEEIIILEDEDDNIFDEDEDEE